jgi:hypothetical protein
VDFDEQLRRHFGTADLDTLPPEAITSGVEKMLVEFGLEKDRGRRFAMWTLLHMLGAAPDLDIAFSDDEDREAARDFMEMMEQEDGD